LARQDKSEMRRQMGSFLARAAHAVGELKDVVVRNSQIGKIKLDVSALRRDRDLAMQRLGAAYFEAAEGGAAPQPADAGMQALFEQIRALDLELEQQDTELAAVEAEAAMHRNAALIAAQAAQEAEAALADDKYEAWGEAATEPAGATDAPEEKKVGG
jgi:hypothetical protein